MHDMDFDHQVRNMRFAVICSFLPSIIRFRGALLEEISQQGYEIHILSPNIDKHKYDIEILKLKGYYLHNIPMQRTGVNPIIDLKTFNAIYRCLKEIKPHYLFAYTIKPVIYGMLAGYFAHIPRRYALITGLGYFFQNNIEQERYFSLYKVVCKLYFLALNSAEKVFFQNPDDKVLFLRLGLLRANKPSVVVNGSGVDVNEFQVVNLPNFTSKKEISFLLIARLLIDKGVREYVQAARKIKAQYPDVVFNLVGWIDDNPSAITQKELDLWIAEGVVKYWGMISDVRPAIQQSSVYVLPSYREGTPRTVLEAMAMGRAIITTDAPGCRETVIHGKNGYLVEVKSVESLEKAMRKFINNPSLIKKMGLRSRQIVLEKYDVNQVNLHMLNEMGIK